MRQEYHLTFLRDAIQLDPCNRGIASLFPLCPGDFSAACASIAQARAPRVGIFTGFWIPDAVNPAGETDGPLGAVFLASAFDLLGIAVEIYAEPFCCPAIEAGLEAAGLTAAVEIRALPIDCGPDQLSAFNDWRGRGLSHLIAIEKVGPAAEGKCFSMRGIDITAFVSPVHVLFEAALQQGLTTIGIGDGGNEIGMGKIPARVIERCIPLGAKIACRVPTDSLLVAGVSNWGAYALAAGVALCRGAFLPGLFDPQRELSILETMVRRGPLIDGKTGQAAATVDGLIFEDYICPFLRIGDRLEEAGRHDSGLPPAEAARMV